MRYFCATGIREKDAGKKSEENMDRKRWIGCRGEDIQRGRLAILRAGWAGRIIDKRQENVGYDWEVHRPNLLTGRWEIERHEVKTKSRRSGGFPALTPNERKARKKYGREYHVDNVELPPYEEWFYDEFVGRD